MANIFKNPTHKAQIGYNGFDMSYVLKFSSSVGELLPVYYDILQPGDKITANVELKTRTRELERAAMAHINQHVEWFFVPMTQLYTLFGDFYYGINDRHSSIFDMAQLAHIPYLQPDEVDILFYEMAGRVDDYFPLRGTGLRLMEMLGLPVSRYAKMREESQTNDHMAISPVLACAYQKIYADFYRLEDREVNNPSLYNLDQFYDPEGSRPTYLDFASYYTLRYRARKKDFFTSVYTSPLFGSESLGAMIHQGDFSLTDSFQQWLVGQSVQTIGSQASISTSIETSSSSFTESENPTAVSSFVTQYSSGTPSKYFGSSASIYAALSPTSIRTSFAVQKMLEVTRRAGKSYDAQTLAHFGVNVPKGIEGHVTFLGSQESDIKIGDVIATAGTDQTPLGQIGGKGYGYLKGRNVQFTAPCHGVLMAIYSSDPDSDYVMNGLDSLNTMIDRSSWPTPEYDNLGMQPLFAYQGWYDGASYGAYINGWQYRYSQFKTKYNRVGGVLSRSLHYWTSQDENYKSSFAVQPLNKFLVDPTSINDIMLVGYNFRTDQYMSTPNQANLDLAWDTDIFLHEMYLDVKKASKMSTYGLESL